MRPLLDQVKQHRRVANVTIFWLKMATFKRQVFAGQWCVKGEANRTQAQLTDFSPSYLTHTLPLSTCIVAIILSNFVLYRRARNKTPPYFFLKIAFWENFFFFPSRCRSTFFWGPINQSFSDQNWNGGGSSQPGPEIKNAAAEVLLVCHRSRLNF